MGFLLDKLKAVIGWVVAIGVLIAGVFFAIRWRAADSQQQAALNGRAELLREKTLASAREAKQAQVAAQAHGVRAQKAKQAAVQRIKKLEAQKHTSMATLVKRWNGA